MTFQPALKTIAAMTVAVSLTGCGPMLAQNPSSALKPVNAVKAEQESRLMLKGADVVAYFTQGEFVQGMSDHRSQHEGVDFRFASAEHKLLFDKSPSQYLPQFGGYCANGIAYGIPWGGDADTWKMIDGKLYIFGGQASKDAFELDSVGNLSLAQRYWDTEIKGNNSFLQRIHRLVFKVPHYQTGDQLAQSVARAKAVQLK